MYRDTAADASSLQGCRRPTRSRVRALVQKSVLAGFTPAVSLQGFSQFADSEFQPVSFTLELVNPEMSTSFPRPGKGYYTESEAARVLGVSIDTLRCLVRQHILAAEPEAEANLPMTTFQPSDLLLLRFLLQTDEAAAAAR